jgi:eukaryotic-like serine/threonine-protein kinase
VITTTVPGLTALLSFDPRMVGDYTLLGRLGHGGQGTVFLATDSAGNRVAVKTVNLNLRDHTGAAARFAREIAAARKVAPFCTAQILDDGIDGDLPYVVSEYIPGQNLLHRVRDHGPVSGGALHRLAIGTATALTAIHKAGVVHCDFKPDNVIMGPDGARVIDFGIAQALDGTQTQAIRGAPAFMAPERFKAAGAHGSCDIWAWGATVAYAAAGRAPFGFGDPIVVMNRIINDPPDLAAFPAPLDDLVRRCLDKDPGRRPNAHEVLLCLLGHDARTTGELPLETVLLEGSSIADNRTTVVVEDMPPRSTFWSRLRGELGDPWGNSLAIFVGAVGGATGYVTSTAAFTGVAVGGITFGVVYLVRLLTAAAMPSRHSTDRDQEA